MASPVTISPVAFAIKLCASSINITWRTLLLPVYSPNYSHNNFNSYDTLNSCSNKNNIVFADASGSYRRWGDDFVDCKGNWCKWGTGFYDYDGNYIRWGNMYKDISGAYRRWGDDFVDGNGDWVHL